MPPIPNAKPKNNPDTAPTLPGMSSWANTRMAENADANISPMMKLKIPVHNRPTCGSSIEKGATPRMENQMTRLRPTRSPIGPPKSVPRAEARRKQNRYSCADCTDKLNFSMR